MNKKAESKIKDRGEERFRGLLNYWIRHNREHTSELERWIQRMEEGGWEDSAQELRKAVALALRMDRHLESALEKFSDRERGAEISPSAGAEDIPGYYELRKIGTIHTPYSNFAPYQDRKSVV